MTVMESILEKLRHHSDLNDINNSVSETESKGEWYFVFLLCLFIICPKHAFKGSFGFNFDGC